MAAACVPALAGCSTGFASPLRHATANWQAASADVGNLEIRDAIVALPSDDVANKGGVAYVQFTVVNLANRSDQLTELSTAASPNAVPTGSTTVPAATASGPGELRMSVALEPLTEQLRAGGQLAVTLSFADAGAVRNLGLPVQSADVVASFLPSSPPPVPVSSAPVSSAPASQVPASAPVSSAPASSPMASSPAAGAPLASGSPVS